MCGKPRARKSWQKSSEPKKPWPDKMIISSQFRDTTLAAEVSHRVGRLEVTAYPVIHACGAPPYAIRVECAGRVIAYSGDTEWTDKLVEVADQADLFICEAYFFEKKVKFHLDYQTLLSHRQALRCKRLVLTHMNSDMLAHSMDLSIECAHDGFAIML